MDDKIITSQDIINKMTTKYYKTLKFMYDNQVQTREGYFFVPMTQVEIAENVAVSKITMNAIIKNLRESKLLYSSLGKRGRYYLTKKAKILIEGIDSIINEMNKIDEK